MAVHYFLALLNQQRNILYTNALDRKQNITKCSKYKLLRSITLIPTY